MVVAEVQAGDGANGDDHIPMVMEGFLRRRRGSWTMMEGLLMMPKKTALPEALMELLHSTMRGRVLGAVAA
jgi:hypothetical protein